MSVSDNNYNVLALILFVELVQYVYKKQVVINAIEKLASLLH